MNRAEWTKISIEQLDEIKAQLKASLKELGERTGAKYRIRTFYLGARKTSRFSRCRGRTTNRADATAAKIAIYKFYKGKFGSGNFELEAYL